MALTYYIRSWDPRSTYPTNPQEGDICYTITLDQTWAPVGGVKKDNIVKEEIYQNGAWVEQGGGVNPSPTPSTKLYEGEFTTTQEDPNYPAQGDIEELLTVVPKATPPASLNVNFKGTDYDLPLIEGSISYGEGSEGSFVYTTYPLAVELWADPAGGDYNGVTIYTAEADTGSITISFTPA